MGAVGLMFLSLFALGWILLKIVSLQEEQTRLVTNQSHIENQADATKQKIDETKKQIDATKKKVDEAVEAAPKIEIDASGNAKVVVPIKTADPGTPPEAVHSSKPLPTADPSAVKPPPRPLPSTAVSAPLGAQIPIETKKL